MSFRLLFIVVIFGKCLALDNNVSAQTATTDSTAEELVREVKAMKVALNQMMLRDSQQNKQLSDTRESIVLLKRENIELKKDNIKLKRESAELNSRVRRLELYKGKERETSALRKINKTSLMSRDKNKRQDRLNQKSIYTKKQILGHSSINPREGLLDASSTNTGRCDENIGFTAHRFRNSVHLNTGQTIIFNKVVSNIGGLYNANTGVFTTDTAGIYVFYVNILCMSDRFTRTELVRDGNSLTIQVCDGIGNVIDNGSSMTVIDLPVGASVWIRVRTVDSNDKDELGEETSFSGFLLKCT